MYSIYINSQGSESHGTFYLLELLTVHSVMSCHFSGMYTIYGHIRLFEDHIIHAACYENFMKINLFMAAILNCIHFSVLLLVACLVCVISLLYAFHVFIQ